MANNNNDENIFLRLTKLFRSGPTVKRRVKDYTPNTKNTSAFELFRKTQSHVYSSAMSAYGSYDRMARYSDFQEMEYCVIRNTLIATPESQTGFMTIGELADMCKDDPNKSFIVYSYDHEKKQIVPAVGKQARQTRIDHAWKVTFDSGKSITASAEHRLMLRDGTYAKVEDLKIGDSMMPFYRKDLFENANSGRNGYQWIYTMNPVTNGWEKEHRLVAELIANRKLTEDEVVHHINFIKHDNRPQNLKIMTQFDHNSYHSNLNNKIKWNEETNCEWIDTFKKNHAEWCRKNAPTKRRDVTFGRILETCERVGFKPMLVASVLDIDINLLHERLVAQGFGSFDKFADAYQRGLLDTYIDKEPGLLTRDLSLDMIKENIKEDDTKRTLAVKLGCTVNVLEKFFDRRLQKTWRDFRKELGYSAGKHESGGRPKGNYTANPDVTLKSIYDAYTPGLTLPLLSKKLGVKKHVILSRLNAAGHKKYCEFTSGYQNHKVVSIEYVGELPLYDLTVDGYKNFATDSVISHNTPEIASALDIYAEESVAPDEHGNVLHIYSENPKINKLLNELFYDTLNVNFNLTSWVRNVCKYGDFFLFNDVSPNEGVINVYPIAVNEIEREEGFDKDDPLATRFRWMTQGNQILENWQISHFRILGNDAFLPYGTSVLEAARRIWRQLILIEDAMLVYRIVRAPDRRVFYIDVGNIAPEEIPNYMEQAQTQLKKNQVVDKTTGRVDLRYNPLSVDEDYFLPVRGTQTGTKIDTLAGGQNAAAVEDVQYIQKKLFAALKIPKAYLGYDEGLGAKATLSQEDIRFSRSVNRIQRTILSELSKIAIIHLHAHGFSGTDLLDFDLKLTNPSTIAQQQKLELYNTKFTIAQSANSVEGLVDKKWIRKNVFMMSDQEIRGIEKGLMDDKALSLKIESIQLEGAPEAQDIGTPQGDMGALSAEPSPEVPQEEPTQSEPTELSGEQVPVAETDVPHIHKISNPIKPSSKLSLTKSLLGETAPGPNYAEREKKNAPRRTHNTMTNHLKLVSHDAKKQNDSISHPFGHKDDLINPFKNGMLERDDVDVNEYLEKNIAFNDKKIEEFDKLLKSLQKKTHNSGSNNTPGGENNES